MCGPSKALPDDSDIGNRPTYDRFGQFAGDLRFGDELRALGMPTAKQRAPSLPTLVTNVMSTISVTVADERRKPSASPAPAGALLHR